MKTRTLSAYKQRGFSLLTGFILSIIMFGTLAFFLAGQGINAGFGTAFSNTSKVSALVTSGGYINTGFDAVTMGGTTADKVTFDTTALTGVFNPTTGGASPQSLDPTLFARTNTTDGYWIYRGNDVAMKGVGDPSAVVTKDYTMMVSGLKKSVCQQINNTLHGIALTTNPGSLGLTDLLTFGAPLAATPSIATVTGNAVGVDLTGVAAVNSGWMNGCYATTTPTLGATDVNYVYIHTLLAQ